MKDSTTRHEFKISDDDEEEFNNNELNSWASKEKSVEGEEDIAIAPQFYSLSTDPVRGLNPEINPLNLPEPSCRTTKPYTTLDRSTH